MVEPVSVLFANYFCEGRLVGQLSGLLLKRFLDSFNGDLWPAFIILNELLLTNDTPGSKVFELLRLELPTLEVEQAEGIFLPRLRFNDQSTPQYVIRCSMNNF